MNSKNSNISNLLKLIPAKCVLYIIHKEIVPFKGILCLPQGFRMDICFPCLSLTPSPYPHSSPSLSFPVHISLSLSLSSPLSPHPVPGRGSPPLLTSPPYADYITVTLVTPEYPNGVITQYNIRWYREGQVDRAQVVTVPGTQQGYTLSGLSPGTYIVQVCANFSRNRYATIKQLQLFI